MKRLRYTGEFVSRAGVVWRTDILQEYYKDFDTVGALEFPAAEPLTLEWSRTDKEAVQMCIRTCNGIDPARVRVIRIPNSLHIGQIMLSAAYYEDVKAGKYPGVEALDEPAPLEFDADDNVVTPVFM